MNALPGFLKLVDGVTEWFETAYAEAPELAPAIVSSFAKARWRQDNQGKGRANRVCFLYGARLDSAGNVVVDAGEYTAARGVGGNPRHLRSWEQKHVVAVWANGETPHDDRATIIALEDLSEQVHQAAQYVLKADAIPGRIFLNTGPNEHHFGAELLFELKLSTPIFDVTYEQATGVPVVVRAGIKKTIAELGENP